MSKICILTPRFPFPENGGDVLRINNIARYLKSKNNELILVSFYENEMIEKQYEECTRLYDKVYYVNRNKISSLFFSLLFFLLRKPIQCGYYFSFKFLKLFNSVIKSEKPDFYISHLIRMCPYLKLNLLEKESIVEMTDALSKTYSLSKNSSHVSLKRIIYFFEKNNVKRYEQKVIKKFNKVVLVSKDDIKYIGNHSNVFYHTNGINLSTSIDDYKRNKICFIGNMRSLQNQDAVLYFINEIFPLIKKECASVEFHIVGALPPKNILSFADNKNIFVTGFVDSVEEYVKDSCLICAPIKIAAGIQNKILLGMACKLPVVITSLTAKAIPQLKSGVNCLIADDPDEFAKQCLDIIKDSDLRNRIRIEGYNVVKNNYSWNEVLKGYEVLN